MNVRKIAAATAGFLALGLAGLALLAFALVRPAQANIGRPPQNLNAESVTITDDSGHSVGGWFLSGQADAGAVLLLHAVRADRRMMVERARFLHRDGFSVLLIDLQAHGETRGKQITFGALESRDAHAAMRYLRNRVGSERIGVIGVSLGGAAALLGNAPLQVEAMVLESVYSDIRQAIDNRLRVRLGTAGSTLAPLLIGTLRLWTGLSVDQLEPVKAIRDVSAPLLVIGGTEDARTTSRDTQRLFAAASSEKELWLIAGAGHDDYHAVRRREYEERVGAFLRRYLRE